MAQILTLNVQAEQTRDVHRTTEHVDHDAVASSGQAGPRRDPDASHPFHRPHPGLLLRRQAVEHGLDVADHVVARAVRQALSFGDPRRDHSHANQEGG